MTKLFALSSEILTMICDYLSTPDRAGTYQENLSSLCLTSRRLYRMVQPFLYREVRPLNIGAFVQTVMKRPDLAAQVKSLDLLMCRCGEEELEILPTIAPAASDAQPVAALDEDPLEFILQNGPQHLFAFMMDLLLTRLPGLELLDVRCSEVEFEDFFLAKRLACHPGQRILPSLQKLTFRALSPDGPTGATSVIPVLALSGVRQFYLEGCDRIDFELWAGDFSLEDIVLNGCFLDADDLEPLIKKCPSLKSFSIRLAKLTAAQLSEYFIISITEIIEILESVKDQLEKLCLHIYCKEAENQEGDENGRVLRSLAAFTNLQELEICQHDLTNGQDFVVDEGTGAASQNTGGDNNSITDFDESYRFVHKLPTSLQRLTIFNATADIYAELVNLIGCAPIVLPNLRYIATSGMNFTSLVSKFEEIDIELIHLPESARSLRPYILDS